MTSTNESYVNDKVRCWYYTSGDSVASIGLGYAHFAVSDGRNKRTDNGDIALVISKVVKNDTVQYLAHVSQIVDADLPNPKEVHKEIWGCGNPDYEYVAGRTTHRVRHLTRIHNVTDYIAKANVGFSQAGVDLKDREGLVYELIFLG